MRRLALIALLVFAPSYAKAQEAGIDDLLQKACNLTDIAAICQVADALSTFQTNFEDFISFGKDQITRFGEDLIPSLSDLFKNEVAGDLELPEEVQNLLNQISKLPKDSKEKLRDYIAQVNKGKAKLTEEALGELRSLFRDLGKENDAEVLLSLIRKADDDCSNLATTPTPLDGSDYQKRADDCRVSLAERKAVLKKIAEVTAGDVQKIQETAEKFDANRALAERLERSKPTMGAQVSAKRTGELANETFKIADQASQSASKLKDNAQNAVSTRAAVQVLAEGMAELMDKNITTLSLVQASLAELARQSVYTNEQIGNVAEAVVRNTAKTYNEALSQAQAESDFFIKQADYYFKKAEQHRKMVQKVFDDGCIAQASGVSWVEACAEAAQ